MPTSYMKLTSTSKIKMILPALAILILLLASSTLNQTHAQSASSNSAAASTNWLSGGNYPLNWNYNSQNVINTTNVQNLAISWVFPIPAAPAAYTSSELSAEGVIEPVLVYQGIAYFITNWHRVYALSAADGTVLWYKDLPINFSAGEDISEAVGHYHMIWITTHIQSQPLVWVVSNDFHIFALNALTGDIIEQFQPVNASLLTPGAIPGNYGVYDSVGNTIVVDDQRGIVMFGPGDNEGADAGRGFLEAYDVNTTSPTLMWRDFIMPPQNNSDPNWDMQSIANMTNAYIFNGTAAINLKSLSAAQLNSTFYDDWGTMGFNGTNSFAGTNTAWGGTWAINENTGTAYIGTSQASPDWNATFRPGPDLWSDSIMSINDESGAINWAFQTSAHDTWDWDCSWSVVLGNVTVNGQSTPAVFKGCKNGYFYALNANNGSMLWYFDAPSIQRAQYSQLHNPLNATQMDLATQCGSTCTSAIQNPTATGGIESDPAYDPTTQMVFVATYNEPTNMSLGDVPPTPGQPYTGAGLSGETDSGTANTTIDALNANTGQLIWAYNIANVGYRGGLTVSGGVVFIPALDGNLYMVNEMTGTLISKLLVGEMNVEPAIAQDTNGNWKLIVPVSSAGTVGGTPIPGNIIAISLPSTNSSASAVVSPTTMVTTVTTGVSGATSVMTVTTQVTASSSGVSSGAFYGVVVVAIILLITTAFFAMRRRPAASSSSTTSSSTSTT
jgi:outer membrane protein assembly factor BamB